MSVIVKPPKQPRSIETFKKVIKAGKEILTQSNHEGFSIQDISERSGVSVGSIYQRFENKDKLYLVLQDAILNDLDGSVTNRFSKNCDYDSDAAAVHDTVWKFAQHVQANDQVLRSMIVRGGSDRQVNARGNRSSNHIGRAFISHLNKHVKVTSSSDRDAAFEMALRIVYACLWRWVTEPSSPETGNEIRFSELVQELCVVCEHYLL